MVWYVGTTASRRARTRVHTRAVAHTHTHTQAHRRAHRRAFGDAGTHPHSHTPTHAQAHAQKVHLDHNLDDGHDIRLSGLDVLTATPSQFTRPIIEPQHTACYTAITLNSKL